MSSDSEFVTFGRWLKFRRKLLDLTQDQLGRLAGCSGAAVRKFEADERKPSRQLAELLASSLQIPEFEREAFVQLARGIRSPTLPGVSPVVTSPQLSSLPPENLPAPLTSLVDRGSDTAAISALLTSPSVRWITLVGPPGIGKTRLSILVGRQVLADFPDGVWFVDLAPLENPGHVLPAVGRVLAVYDLPPSPNIDLLSGALKDRTTLLVLDNFEHVTATAAEIAELLKRCAQLKVLATSRVPLNIYGEHLYRVAPLPIPLPTTNHPQHLMEYESVQLFVVRARQHQPSFAVTSETAVTIAGIVRTLDGIPLALELAAATLQRLSLAELDGLLHRLSGESWLRQISAPARNLPERQHTLENVVAWSYSLLTESQQELFCKLAVFSGWFDADAVAAICYNTPQPDSAAVRPLLDNLAEASLLERNFLIGRPCWRMLEIIHEFAGLQLSSAAPLELAERRIHYLLGRLESIAGMPDPVTMESFFFLHIHNLQASLKWAIAGEHTELGFQLAGYLDDLWSGHGYFKEVLEFMKQLFTLPDSAPPEVRIRRLQSAADLAWQQHEFETGLTFAREAVELGRLHGLPGESTDAFNRLGRIYLELGEYAQAHQVLTECLAIARANPQSLNPGAPLAQLGELSLFEGQLDEAKIYFDQALEYLDESNAIFLAITLVDLVEIALTRHDLPQAQNWLQQAYAYARVHIRRTLVYLCAAAGVLLLASEQNKAAAGAAASLYGAIDTLGERSGVIFSPFYQKLNQARIQVARQSLTTIEWQAAYLAGQQWNAETALAQARQACDA